MPPEFVEVRTVGSRAPKRRTAHHKDVGVVLVRLGNVRHLSRAVDLRPSAQVDGRVGPPLCSPGSPAAHYDRAAFEQRCRQLNPDADSVEFDARPLCEACQAEAERLRTGIPAVEPSPKGERRNRSGQVFDVWAAHAERDGVGGFARCPFKGRVVVLGEPNVQRLVTGLRDLGDEVGHYRCAQPGDWGEHYHVTDVTGTTAGQRKRWRRKRGVDWVKRRPGRRG